MSAVGGGASLGRLGPDRWHFQHGPIDLVIDIDADAPARERSLEACWDEFQHVLPALVSELPEVRRPASTRPAVRGPVAQRMLRACLPFADERYITPMAAVAGAVADHLIHVFARPGVTRACINNGGDIALLLVPGARYRVGICSQPDRADACSGGDIPLSSVFHIDHASPVRGIATSGWRGRSFSLGIADSVTVLAGNAAAADAAATLIANAVNCDHPGIMRAPASQLKDDTDLGDLLVTVNVPRLPAQAIALALSRGRAEAERLRDRGLIHAAAAFLQGRVDLVLPRAAAESALGTGPMATRALAPMAMAGLAMPGVATTGVGMPGVAMPGLATPGVATPGVATRGLATPGVATPGVATPGSFSPSAVRAATGEPRVA